MIDPSLDLLSQDEPLNESEKQEVIENARERFLFWKKTISGIRRGVLAELRVSLSLPLWPFTSCLLGVLRQVLSHALNGFSSPVFLFWIDDLDGLDLAT
jgi:hypothetical protein